MSTRQQTALILWVVRDYGTLTFNQIYHVIFSGEPKTTPPRDDLIKREPGAAHDAIAIMVAIQGLTQILTIQGLLQADGDPPAYKVSHALLAVRSYFHLSLTNHILSSTLVMAEPIFGEPLNTPQENWADVFVMMPFQELLKPVYENCILQAVTSINLTCNRGDDFFSNQAIMDEVWSAIYHAQLCIADCTGRNPNVFYELGIAHTLGRPCILVAQSADDIPFDIRHRRVIVYTPSPEGLEIFHNSLIQTIHRTLST